MLFIYLNVLKPFYYVFTCVYFIYISILSVCGCAGEMLESSWAAHIGRVFPGSVGGARSRKPSAPTLPPSQLSLRLEKINQARRMGGFMTQRCNSMGGRGCPCPLTWRNWGIEGDAQTLRAATPVVPNSNGWSFWLSGFSKAKLWI